MTERELWLKFFISALPIVTLEGEYTWDDITDHAAEIADSMLSQYQVRYSEHERD